MENNMRENLTNENSEIREEDTFVKPPTPDFEAAAPSQVQSVVPVEQIPNPAHNSLPQQPQVVYVAQPATVLQPQKTRSWSWIPAALVLLVVATIAGAFAGAQFYKRASVAETSPTATDPSVEEFLSNSNKAAKKTETERAETHLKAESLSATAPKQVETIDSPNNDENAVAFETHNVSASQLRSENRTVGRRRTATQATNEEQNNDEAENTVESTEQQASESKDVKEKPAEEEKPLERKAENSEQQKQTQETDKQEKQTNSAREQQKQIPKMEKVANEKDVNGEAQPPQ